MILESLGIPDNILNLSQQVYSYLINEIPKYGDDILTMSDYPITIDGDFRISDYTFDEIEVGFDFYEYESLEFVGMSYNLGSVRVKNVKFLVQDSDFNKVKLKISFAVDDTVTPNSIQQFMKLNRDDFVSSISHELKHAYDSFKKPTTPVEKRVDYSVYRKTFGEIKPLNELLFNLYFTHQIENLVRPTEFASLVKEKKVTKKQFLKFLTNSNIFKKLDSARNFTYDNLKTSLKDYLPEIVEVINESGGDSSDFKTEDELINEILRLFYVNLVNWSFESMKSFLSSNVQEVIFGLPPEKEDFLKKYTDTLLKYNDDVGKFYNIHEKHIKKVSNNMIKKLGKVYSYIKDDDKLKNESIINPDVWYRLKENKSHISNKINPRLQK